MAQSLNYSLDRINSNSANLRLDLPISKIPQVSTARIAAFESLGISSIRNLLNYFPVNYIDMSNVSTIADTKTGFDYTIAAKVFEVKLKEPKLGLKLVEITLVDDTGTLIATSFRQLWLADQIKKDDLVACSGKVSFEYGFKRISNPIINLIENNNKVTDFARIMPVYKSNKKISSAWIHRIIINALDFIGPGDSVVPDDIIKKYKLENYFDALNLVHRPKTMQDVHKGIRSLKYTQALLHFCKQYNNYKYLFDDKKPFEHNIIGENLKTIVNNLKLPMDEAVTNCFSNICLGMSANSIFKTFIYCKNSQDKQLLQALAIAIAIDSDKKCIICTASSTRKLQITNYLENIAGTLRNSIIFVDLNSTNTNISLENVSCIIIDEAQNYSIKFLKNLSKAKNNKAPDILCFSTCFYSQHYINCMYYDFKKIDVYNSKKNFTIKAFDKKNSQAAYDLMYKELEAGHQAIIFNPLLGINHNARQEMSGKSINDNNSNSINYDVVSVDEISNFKHDNIDGALGQAKVMEAQLLKTYEVKVLHNSLSDNVKVDIVEEFASKKFSILHCVGPQDLDIYGKDVSIVIVEDADRLSFNLINQMKNCINGKYCKLCLINASSSKTSKIRSDTLMKCDTDAQLINAEYSMMGQGNFYQSHKDCFKVLKLIDFSIDNAILDTAKKDAKDIYDHDKNLSSKEHRTLSFEIARI